MRMSLIPIMLPPLNEYLTGALEAAKRADAPAYPRRVRDLEMDEFWSFVGAKRRQRWTWYGVRHSNAGHHHS